MSHSFSSLLSPFHVSQHRFRGRAARATAKRATASAGERSASIRPRARRDATRDYAVGFSPRGEMLRSSKHGASNSPRMSASGDDEAEAMESLDTAELLPSSDKLGSKHQGVDWVATGFAFLFPAIAGLLFGWDIGSTSGALTNIMDPVHSGTNWYALDPFQQGLVVSTSLAGALVASGAAAVSVGDALGSKRELLLASLFYAAGAAVQGAAPSLEVLVVGRFTYGLGIGFAMHAAPMYIAETAPSSVRGLLISLKEGFIVGGILLGYLGSYIINGEDDGWRTLLSSSIVLSGALALGMVRLPDSPRWLAQQGRSDDARAALVKVRGKRATGDAFEAEVEAMTTSSHMSGAGGVSELFQKQNLRPLYIGLSVVLFQQITGQPSVLYYAEQVFEAAGYDSSQGAGVSVILGSFKILMTGFAVKYVDTLGRRPLLLGGVAVMTLSTVALGLCFQTLTTADAADAPMTAQMSLVAIFMYVGAYQVSFGPIAWLLVGEIFPQRVRSAAVGAATLTNFFSNFLVSLYLPTLINQFGTSGTYFLFSVCGVVAMSSIYLTVPETKGKTLEEIEDQMTK